MKEEYRLEALRELRGNISKFSRTMGIDYADARALYAPHPLTPAPGDIRALGAGNLKAFVIAVKRHSAEWPIDEPTRNVLNEARRKVDAGTHIMCQGRHPDGWTVQYLIPRRRPLRRPKPFFYFGVVT